MNTVYGARRVEISGCYHDQFGFKPLKSRIGNGARRPTGAENQIGIVQPVGNKIEIYSFRPRFLIRKTFDSENVGEYPNTFYSEIELGW